MSAVAQALAFPEAKPRSTFAADVISGLTGDPKHLPAKYFYDRTGSELFDRITRLPEYYPTRTELALLREHRDEIAQLLPAGGALIEFGSGSAIKAEILLSAAPQLAAYVPVDISTEHLHQEASRLRHKFPSLRIIPIDADFCAPFGLADEIATLPHAGFFPGSTIGNFEPHEASKFLHNAATILGHGAVFVIGVDLVKDRAVLHAAYNDAAGVTAAFNRNLLVRINRELAGSFDLKTFEHHAFFNRERSRIEMHLASTKRQKVKVDGETIEFRAGETIHTENSYKYTVESFGALARGAGWRVCTYWTDPQNYFAVFALQA